MTTDPQTVTEIPVELVVPGDNDRTVFDPDKLAELADSIRDHGLAQPITVRPYAGGRYQIVAGERRFRAVATVLGRPTVPAIVRDLNDADASAIMLAENLSRVDLDPIAEARAYQARMDALGIAPGEVAKMAGVSVARVITRTPLLRLVEEAQQLVRRGELSINHARTMADLDANRQRYALKTLAAGKLTLDEFRSLCQRLAMDQAEEGATLFELTVDEYVAQAHEARVAKIDTLALVAGMAAVLHAAGLAPELVAQARALTDKETR